MSRIENTCGESAAADTDVMVRRVQLLILVCLMVAGLGLRLRGTGDRLLDHDEAFSWRVASRPVGMMIEQVAGDTHPLFHFFVLKAVLLSGMSSVLALRAPSVAVGVATIWAVFGLSIAAVRYAVKKDIPTDQHARWAGLAAAAYVSFHPYHITVSSTARMYSFATFFAALSTWLLLDALRLQPPSRLRYAAFAIVVALMLHTHHFGIFLFAAQAGFAVFEAGRCRSWLRLRALVEAGCLVVMVYLPWIPSFLGQAKRVHDWFWIPPLTGEGFGEILASVLFGREVMIDGPTGIVLACFILTALAWASVRVGGIRSWMLPLQVFTIWIAATLISTFGGRPILQDRYLILACPAFAGWYALALATTRAWLARLLLVSGLMAPTLYALWLMLAGSGPRPLSTFEAVAYLREIHKSGDVILVGRPGTVNVFRYYQTQIPGLALDVRYVLEPRELKRIGQACHLSSFDPDDWIAEERLGSLDAVRLWVVNNSCDLRATSWTRQTEITFGTTRGEFLSGLQLISYTPTK
jgi:hypothetical protein